MRTISFDGTQLTPGQRRMLEQQRHVRAFMNPVLAEQVEQTLKVVEERKEQGVKPERVWFEERKERGTICIAEWMGY